MILEFTYNTRQLYSLPVVNHHYALNCLPSDTERQRIISTELEITPECTKNYKDDIFGNKIIYGYLKEPHDNFNVRLSGIAQTGYAVCEHIDDGGFFADIFKAQSRFTVPGRELIGLYEKHKEGIRGLNSYNTAVKLMKTVYHTMNYVPGITTVATTAEQALLKRCGVCQDYAHILISLCRMAGIPARYVVGMMVGEGASHAWTEVLCGRYWYGLDPTNDLLVDESYIKLTQGRDYGDTVVLKGVFNNFTIQRQEISVSVCPCGKELQ